MGNGKNIVLSAICVKNLFDFSFRIGYNARKIDGFIYQFSAIL